MNRSIQVLGLSTLLASGVASAAAPENDDIAAAELLVLESGSQSYSGTNVDATTETDEVAAMGLAGPSKSIWYRIHRPPLGSSFTITTDGSSFDTILSVFRGPADAEIADLVEVGGDDDGGSGSQSQYSFAVTGAPEPDYYIAIDGFSGQSGSVTLNVVAVPPTVPPACNAGGVFPAICPEPLEKFEGGADPFDLDRHAITFVPVEVMVNGHTETHYEYSVHRIRKLPVDLSEIEPLSFSSGDLPSNGFEVFGETTATMKASRGSISFKDSSGETMVPELAVFETFAQPDYLIEDIRVLEESAKTTIQFDYYVGSGVDLGFVPVDGYDLKFQAELFQDGMFRFSYFGIDAEETVVGLTNGGTFPAEDDLSAARLAIADVVVNEAAGTAGFTVALPAVQGPSFGFDVETSDGTALDQADFLGISTAGSIAGGVLSTTVSVPLVVDSVAENEEFFGLKVVASGDPERVLGTADGWILDTAPGTSSAPLVEVLGNRVFIRQSVSDTAVIGGYRLVSIDGGVLRNAGTGEVIPAGGLISTASGLAGLLTSGPGVSFVIEALADVGGAVLGSTAFDVDGASGSPVFQFSLETLEVVEGSSAEVVVESSGGLSSVSYEILPMTAVPASGGSGDYLPVRGALRFEAGRASIFIPILSDRLNEGVEEFHVRLIDPGPGAFIGPRSVLRVLISDGLGVNRPAVDQVMPESLVSGRRTRLDYDPVDFPGADLSQAWRFRGEPFWRPAGANAWNVMEGFQLIESLPSHEVIPFFYAPESYVNQGFFSGLFGVGVSYQGSDGDISPPSPVAASGALQVDFAVGAPSGGKWRRLGQVVWRDPGPGGKETGLVPGRYLVEFKDDIAGYLAPGIRTVEVFNESTSSIEVAYQIRPVAAATPLPLMQPTLGSSGSWTHVPVKVLGDRFEVSFEYQPGDPSAESYVGLSDGKVTNLSLLATIVQAQGSAFRASDGGSYVSDATVAPTAGDWFLVEFVGSVPDGEYDLFVTPPLGSRTLIRAAAAFQGSPAELSFLSMISVVGSHQIRNVRSHGEFETTDGWMVFEIPGQSEIFEAGLVLDVAGEFFGESEQFIEFGVSDARAPAPTHVFDPLLMDVPEEEILTVPIRLEIDSGSGPSPQLDYTVEVIDGTESVSGTLASSPETVSHLYLRRVDEFGDDSIYPFSVLDTAFPAHVVEPSGPAPANDPEDWLHVPIEPQTGTFSMSFDVRTVGETVGVSSDLIDGIVALSPERVTFWTDASVVLRARLPSGGSEFWDAHSGGFSRDGDVPVVDGDLYHVDLEVDVPNETYRATVTPEGGAPVVVMANGVFRASADELRFMTLRNVQGRLEVTNLRGPADAAEDAPLAFTGRIETSRGFGSGVVVADYAVLTSARLVFDPESFSFVPDVIWSLPAVRSSVIPDANQPSGILLTSGYAAAALAAESGGDTADAADVAVLAFRPLNLPKHRNAPGRGGFGGFLIDGGSGSWASDPDRTLVSFPVTGIPAADRGRRHQTDASGVTFSPVTGPLWEVAGGLETPPGSEGAPLFAKSANGRFHPAAICLGSSGGSPRFRAIDATVADAIYQANGFQRQPDYIQELVKGGVYYIPTTLAGSVDANRGHIFSDAIPEGITWILTRRGFGDPIEVAGKKGLSVEAGTYTAKFPVPPSGYVFNPDLDLADDFDGGKLRTKIVSIGSEWHLPEVYLPVAASDYESWRERHFSEAEQSEAEVSDPEEPSPWLGVDNVIAYAFGFDPKASFTHAADPDAMVPGLPIVRKEGSAVWIEFLRRADPDLNYTVEYGPSPAGPWTDLTAPPVTGSTSGVWEHVRWDLTAAPGAGATVIARVRVELAGP